MDTALLTKAGLTEGEIRVYLALLKLGLTTSGPIVNESSIAKSMVYSVLDKLIQKGLVSYIIKEKTKYFQASDPEKIINFIEEREKSLNKTKEAIKKSLPELDMIMKLAKKSEATIYLGNKGLRTAYEKVYKRLEKGGCSYFLGVPAQQPKEQHIYWKRDQLRRIKAGLNMKALFNKDTDSKILENRNSYRGTDARYMPTDIKTPALFMTYKDTTVIMLQSPTVIAVEIINQNITDSFQAYFDEFWKRSKPFK
ncbi:MAG: helix-turn-helix domain-containing protein [Candidatus Nanoarchaeia archaeon]|nr:helix-turn-helix domain-containing protein [Candidatus Nanoarchaeia archaeon]